MSNQGFDWDVTPAGISLTYREAPLLRKGRTVPPQEWLVSAPASKAAAISRLIDLVDDGSDQARIEGDALVLSHPIAANLSDEHARMLSLPPAVPYVLKIGSRGQITSDDFSLTASWRDPADRHIETERTGSMLYVQGGAENYRISLSLYRILEEVGRFPSCSSVEDRFAAVARLQDLVFEYLPDHLELSGIMGRLRVKHATRFSLALSSAKDSLSVDPVLFGNPTSSSGDVADLADESESLHSQTENTTFTKRFQSYPNARSTYALSDGSYVYIDKKLQTALGVIRKLQRSSPDAIQRFAKNPRAILAEELGDDTDSTEIESLFVETVQYSDRVRKIGLWEAPVLPWIKKDPDSWLPEKFGVRIGDKYIQIDPDEVSSLRDKVEGAIESGKPSVVFNGETVPATTQTLDALDELIQQISPDQPKPPPSRPRATTVLVTEDNFVTESYVERADPRNPQMEFNPDTLTRSTLKPHQEEGVDWLHRCWMVGHPGVLLADDMGLGKTLQVLVFLAWLRQVERTRPALIVAPKSLLENWRAEHDHHLVLPGLGEGLVAYGPKLRTLRTKAATDLNRGDPGLDTDSIQDSDWVLTTYETLRDYHISFGKVRFACVVFDEMQRVKNPATLVTHAAKTVNAGFRIGVTGTPVENRLEDLWSIMDILSPGFLGDLKTFSQEYHPADTGSVEKLRDLLFGQSEKTTDSRNPPPAIRRLKYDQIEGLPQKIEHKYLGTMPVGQADAYDKALRTRARGGNVLELLHFLRGISLHPYLLEKIGEPDTDEFVKESARVVSLFQVLDTVSRQHEKAIVFIERLEMQDIVAAIIQRRYKLKRKPLLINGQISGEARQAAVTEFQRSTGSFDVIILSPRAGGVGITLTAATHVIHLSRWWNPAVEDQCTDRAYRIGQNSDVHVHLPLARHPEIGDASFDFVLDALISKKRELVKGLMIMPPVDSQADRKWLAKQLGLTEPTSADEDDFPEGIDQMEPLEFERWVTRKFRDAGFVAHRTPISGDHGADGIFRHKERNYYVVVQCKHTGNPDKLASPEAVKDLLRARTDYRLANPYLLAVTNATDFTDKAKGLAQQHDIILVTRHRLAQWPWI